MVEAELLPQRRHVLGHVDHALIEMGQRDPALVVVQTIEDRGEHMDRVACRAAEHARMKVAIGGRDGDLLAHEAAQHRGDGGGVAVPHARIAHEREITGEFVLVGLEEGMQRWGARFLLALQQDRDRDRQAAGLVDPGARRLDERHELALVVGCAARDDNLRAILAGDHGRVEGVTFPQVQRIDRLHVVVTVEQNVRAALCPVLAVTDDHGVPGCVAYLGSDAERVQLGREPIGGGAAITLEGRIGGDALDLQKVEKAFERGVEVAVDSGENPVEIGHGKGSGA